MKWNLNDLYSSTTDPKIEKDKQFVLKQSQAFTKKYKNKLNSSIVLEKAILAYESFLEKLYWLGSYASYLHSTDTKSPEISKFYQETNEFSNNITSSLVWFKIELANSTSKVKVYDYFLEKIRRKKAFMLSEKEENILTQKRQTSTDALVRFYDEAQSQLTFELKIGKKSEQLSATEIGKIMTKHKDRSLRKRATNVVSKKFSENSHFYTFVLNMLLLDKKIEDSMRGYKNPEQSTYLSYDIDQKTVETMINTIQKNYNISSNFYGLKAKLLNTKLYEWDRYSPVYQTNENYSWEEAKKIVQEAFSSFDATFGEIAKKFFDNNWVDAKITKNRRSGAYCSYLTPSKHPYIFMNFDGKLDDIMTLAHELGHGIHAYLSRDQKLMNFFSSTATAEIASIFAESLVFDYLYKSLKSKETKINLLTEKIQGSFATVFRQSAFHLFEQDLHSHRRDKGELTATEIGEYYQTRLQPMFGKELTLSNSHKTFWIQILHFYHYNFYVFTYAFGELLTLSLYQLYKDSPDKFKENYIKILKAGGSMSPKDLLQTLDQDISDPKFWQNGLNLLENYVSEFAEVIK